VENSHFRGALVRLPSIEELLEAFEVRALLEGQAARRAMHRLGEADLARLEGFLEQMRRAAQAGDPYAEATADAEFHGYIMQRSGNATLERVWRTLEPFLRTYITIVSPGVDRRAVADRHVPILEALRQADEELVARTYAEHLEAAAHALAEVWPGASGASTGQPEAARAPLGVAAGHHP
jgi:DNA-binding GntR family transcriptional regulator